MVWQITKLMNRCGNPGFGLWQSEADLMMNTATFVISGSKIQQKLNKKDLIKPKPREYVTRLTCFAGTLACKPYCPC